MKRITCLSTLLLFVATMAFAHAGEEHTYLGTVTTINDDGSFVMKTKDDKEHTVQVSKDTTWAKADGHAAKPSDLAVGVRVSVKISKDGKTAASVKLGAPAKTEH